MAERIKAFKLDGSFMVFSDMAEYLKYRKDNPKLTFTNCEPYFGELPNSLPQSRKEGEW
jgi:hypothetical protein